ncbi:MAG: hypothetical protein A3A86_00020 [Elusimicrobia bacterium RIFCSPLOWO2_01_FULL_60_11]|nr:MAG: hypothetical protein A3A86_00020 [Elusimicrobia bacterium RIFCSPLOWO2_01_FULL_60_11]
MPVSTGMTNLLLCFILGGCSASFRIRHNLARDQILEPVVLRKPTLEASLGVMPKYQDYLEGYVTGGLVETEGRPLQGVTVHIADASGIGGATFEDGITDDEGMYKSRFSIPIRWNRVDFTGSVSVDAPWQVISPKPEFVISYIAEAGVLAYYAKPLWIPVKNTAPPKPIKPVAPATPPKKPSDGFDGFDLGN